MTDALTHSSGTTVSIGIGPQLQEMTSKTNPASNVIPDPGPPVACRAQVTTGDLSIVEPMAPAWQELSEEGAFSDPFNRPEWVTAYLRAFAPKARLLLLTIHAGSQLRGVLPLVQDSDIFCGIPARVLRSPSNEHSCRFDLVHGSCDKDAVLAEMWATLKHLDSWDVISLLDVPAGGATEKLLELADQDGWETDRWQTNNSPFIITDGLQEPLAHAKEKHFRANLRRRFRNASTRWRVELHRSDAPPADLIETFYSLEASGWKGRQGSAIRSSSATRQFYDEIVAAAARFGYLSLYLLRFDETTVAAHLGLFYNRRYFTPKTAYDEGYSPFSPGHLLVEAVLRDGFTRQMKEFDFLGPSMGWKLDWTSQTRPHSHCYIFRKSMRAHMLYVAFQMRKRLRPLVQRVRSVDRGAHK